MKIVIVNFSGREVGNCQAISQVVGDVHLSDEVYIYHFSSLTVHPCGKCNYECFGREESCPYQDDAVYEIYKKVTVCDLAYFILPNYCDYPNANYFLFNERSQCFFQHRPELLERYLAVYCGQQHRNRSFYSGVSIPDIRERTTQCIVFGGKKISEEEYCGRYYGF